MANTLFMVNYYGDEGETLFLQIDDYIATYNSVPAYDELNEIADSEEFVLDCIIDDIVEKSFESLIRHNRCFSPEMLKFFSVTFSLDCKKVLEIASLAEKVNETIHMKLMKDQITGFINDFYGIDLLCLLEQEEDSSDWSLEYIRILEEFYAYHGRYPNNEEIRGIEEVQELFGDDFHVIPSFEEIREYAFDAVFEFRFKYCFVEFEQFINTNNLLKRWKINENEVTLFFDHLRELQYEAILKDALQNSKYKRNKSYIMTKVQTPFTPWWVTEKAPFEDAYWWDVSDDNEFWKEYNLTDEEFDKEISSVQVISPWYKAKVYFNKLVAWFLIKREMYKLDYHRYPSDEELMGFWNIEEYRFTEIKTLISRFCEE